MIVDADPKNDYAFKSVFGNRKHGRVLVHLLNAILAPYGLRVVSVRVVNPLSDIKNLDEKKLILDVKAVDQEGRLYNVEMQMVVVPSLPERLLYYWANAYSTQLKQGQEYCELQPVISICFLNGTLFPESDKYHLRFRLWETEEELAFTDQMEIHLFQLPKFTKTHEELESDLDLWLYVLNNGKGLDLENLPERLRVAEVEEALEELAMLKQDDTKREMYEAREKARRDAQAWRNALRHAEDQVRHAENQVRHAEEKARQNYDKGVWIGQIRIWEKLLNHTPTPDDELQAMPLDDLRRYAGELDSEFSNHN